MIITKNVAIFCVVLCLVGTMQAVPATSYGNYNSGGKWWSFTFNALKNMYNIIIAGMN